MLTTEAEAKTKRCQESFGDSNIGTGFTQQQALPPSAISFTPTATVPITTSPYTCIGSDCMAWRWAFIANPITGIEQTDRGYCGKAGEATGIIAT